MTRLWKICRFIKVSLLSFGKLMFLRFLYSMLLMADFCYIDKN